MRRLVPRGCTLVVSLLGLLVSGTPLLSQGGRSRGAEVRFDRHQTQSEKRTRVIVRYRPEAGDRLARRFAAHGDRVRRRHDAIGAFAIDLHDDDRQLLMQDPDVAGVSDDAIVFSVQDEPGSAQPPPVLTTPALRRTLGIPATSTGRGVGVAIIDSGAVIHPDLGRMVAYRDFTEDATPVPRDGYGHGSHVAGLVAGTGEASGGRFAGIAPGARLIVLKALDDTGRGYTSDVIEAIEFVIRNRAALRIEVLNLSLGHPIFEPADADPLVLAVERAVDAGIVVVVAAGNHGMNADTGEVGYGGIGSPGNAPSAITVGAALTHATIRRGDDGVAPFSSRGPTWYDGIIKPDLIAPGENLVAVTPRNSVLHRNPKRRVGNGPYVRLSGTSMATAVTSGVVALMIEAHRSAAGLVRPLPLPPNAIKAILTYTAIPVPADGEVSPLVQGAGAVNADGAIALISALDPEAAVGTPWMSTAIPLASVIARATHTWAQQIPWGDRMLWGPLMAVRYEAWTSGILWGDHILWGDSIGADDTAMVVERPIWSRRIVWGEHILWGDHILWGYHILWGDDSN